MGVTKEKKHMKFVSYVCYFYITPITFYYSSVNSNISVKPLGFQI